MPRTICGDSLMFPLSLSNPQVKGILILLLTIVFLFSLNVLLLSAEAISDDFTGYAPSTRAEGMGGAFTALAEGASGIFYNPAGLGFGRTIELMSAHRSLDLEQTIESTALRFELYPGIYSGVAYQKSGVENMLERDAAGTVIGSFDDRQERFSLSQGFRITPWLSLGATAFMTRQEILEASATGQGVDLGLLSEHGPLHFGLTVKNLGHEKKWSGTTLNPVEKYGRVTTAGLAWEKGRNTILYDHSRHQDGTQSDHLGIETKIHDRLTLRAGLADDHASWGFGCNWKNIRLDTAWSSGERSDSWSAAISFLQFGGGTEPLVLSPTHEKTEVKRAIKIEDENTDTKNQCEKEVLKIVHHHFVSREYQAAVNILTDFLLEESDNSDALYIMGLSLRRLGKKADAAVFLGQALEIAPEHKYAKWAEVITGNL
jgi:hypothetical protein